MKFSKNILCFAGGWFLAELLAEISPIFTFGFWRLAASSVCFIMGDRSGSEGDRLLGRIVCSSTPELSLRILYKIGTNQAEVYSLYGLSEIKSDYYNQYLVEFDDSNLKVRLRTGSTTQQFTKHEVADLLRSTSRTEKSK